MSKATLFISPKQVHTLSKYFDGEHEDSMSQEYLDKKAFIIVSELIGFICNEAVTGKLGSSLSISGVTVNVEKVSVITQEAKPPIGGIDNRNDTIN